MQIIFAGGHQVNFQRPSFFYTIVIYPNSSGKETIATHSFPCKLQHFTPSDKMVPDISGM